MVTLKVSRVSEHCAQRSGLGAVGELVFRPPGPDAIKERNF